MDKHLHIVTHDVPWPADYGGVFDLFYKIKCLYEEGVIIHLHCFYNPGKRNPAPILQEYCFSVNYYKRTGIRLGKLLCPYIVQSRSSKELLKELNKDEHPILFEGIHTTYWLFQHKFPNRNVWVRLHNDEAIYYKKLAEQEHTLFRKAYYQIEARLLQRYQKRMAGLAKFITVSEDDRSNFIQRYGYKNIVHLPVFIPWQEVKSTPGIGNFCLYHGNLSVNENSQAAIWLLKNVFNDLNIPFVIAGKNPPTDLIIAAHEKQHTCIVENPSEFELDDLIRKAQVNILPSLNTTGVKLKLIHALFQGRHCIVNENALSGMGLDWREEMPETAAEFKNLISRLYQTAFTENDKMQRETSLRLFNNKKNVKDLISWIY